VTNKTPHIVKQKRLYEKIFRSFVLILLIPLAENAKVIMGFTPLLALKEAIYCCALQLRTMLERMGCWIIGMGSSRAFMGLRITADL